MVKRTLPDKIIKIARSYRDLLENDNLKIDSMIVFGSQSKDKAREDSDIDLCVVSDSFGKNNLLEMQMLFRKARLVDSRIEPYPMNPKDLESTYNPIVSEILKWGIAV